MKYRRMFCNVNEFCIAICASLAVLAFSAPAQASWHFMQIEQVIGGVDGDVTAQAIQLRMRTDSQHLVSNSRLLVVDAAGGNPILLLDMQSDVVGNMEGDRVLIASEQFSSYTLPGAEPDFILDRLIPAEYLQAGSLIFTNDEEDLLVWRLSWGGLSYAGNTNGALTNDADGSFGPPLAGALPSEGRNAVLFQAAANAFSSSNLSDYVDTAGPATFTNNLGSMFVVSQLQCPGDPDNDADGDKTCGDVDNCPAEPNMDQLDSDGDGAGDACDPCPFDPEDDSDGDAVCDSDDNCVGMANPEQADSDGDGAGDLCDACPDDPSISEGDPSNCSDVGDEPDEPADGNGGGDSGTPDGSGGDAGEDPDDPDSPDDSDGGSDGGSGDGMAGNGVTEGEGEGTGSGDQNSEDADDESEDGGNEGGAGSNASGGGSARRAAGFCGMGIVPVILLVLGWKFASIGRRQTRSIAKTASRA